VPFFRLLTATALLVGANFRPVPRGLLRGRPQSTNDCSVNAARPCSAGYTPAGTSWCFSQNDPSRPAPERVAVEVEGA
jgi:hypothetical protein